MGQHRGVRSSGARVAVLVAALSLLAGVGVVVVARATTSDGDATTAPADLSGVVVPTGFARSTATVAAAGSGTPHTFPVWVADSAGGRQRGLMGVTDLGDAQGMVFVFPDDTTAAFWM